MTPSGVLILDKPAGMTSHDVVYRIRRVFGTRKVGHAGTLDPDVTGVLVLCIGSATRLLEYATSEDKTYEGTVCFGWSTTTDDSSGSPIESASSAHLTEAAVQQSARSFLGLYEQQVPQYAAVHVNGKRAYEWAREGIYVEMPVRTVHIQRLEITRFVPGHPAYADFIVRGTKGMYARALCRDLGKTLNVPAHMARLRRIASGPFEIEEAVSLSALEASEDPLRFLLPETFALRGMNRVEVHGTEIRKLAQGQSIPIESRVKGPVAVMSEQGQLVCIAEVTTLSDQLRLKPRKVFWKEGES